MAANAGEKPTAEQQSEPLTGQARSSDGLGEILSVLSLILRALETIVEQQEEMIGLLQAEDDGSVDEVPTRYLNGRPIQ